MDNNLGKTGYAPVEISEPSDSGAIPAVSSRRCVEVVAPTKLERGYQFDVEVNGRTCTIEVPDGGVEQGQHFIATVVNDDFRTSVSATSETYSPGRMNIPVGHWRDGLCDCCIHGCCHPICCLVFWCYPLALGQLLTRLNLTWTADAKRGHDKNHNGAGFSTFKIILGIFVVFISIDLFLQFLYRGIVNSYVLQVDKGVYTEADFPPSAFVIAGLEQVWRLIFGIYFMLVAIKTRSYIRNKYAIPENCCTGCEDCCCVICCNSLTMCQMARHTADYDSYQSGLCTETGLPIDAPEIA